MQVYLPVDGFAELLGAEGFSAEAGKSYIISGERYIPCSKSDNSVKVLDCGVLCAPIEALMSATGLNSTAIVGDSMCIWGVPIFPKAEDVYDAEDLYWLSRIISAESRGEPFLGQLAVGTVVINRTRSDYYPDSIYEVVFDRCGGVQFSPAASGSVYNDPTESSVIAAKMCLEGFSLDDGILFFFNSSIALGSWITSNRTYTMTVGQHDFYS
jgi:N-acetylmuramoyl-L-alanine amidase